MSQFSVPGEVALEVSTLEPVIESEKAGNELVESNTKIFTEYPPKHINLTALCKDQPNLSNCEISRFDLNGLIIKCFRL